MAKTVEQILKDAGVTSTDITTPLKNVREDNVQSPTADTSIHDTDLKKLMQDWNSAGEDKKEAAKKAYLEKAKSKLEEAKAKLKKELMAKVDLEIDKEKEAAIRVNWSKEVAERRKGRSIADLEKDISDLNAKIALKELDIKSVDSEIESVRATATATPATTK